MKKRFIPKNSPEGQMIQQMLNGGRHNLPMFQPGGPLSPAEMQRQALIQGSNNKAIFPQVDLVENKLKNAYKNYSKEDIKRLQYELQEKGYDVGNIDGIMGPRTLAALKQANAKPIITNTQKTFQTLPADQMTRGTVGTYDDFGRNAPEEYQANVTPFTPHTSGRALLKPGVRGSEVEQLQAMLAANGLYKGAIDGVYGPQTRSAVAAFQNQFNSMPRDWNLTSRYKDVIKPGENIDVDGIVGDQTRAALEATFARKPGVTASPHNNYSVVASDKIAILDKGTGYQQGGQVDEQAMMKEVLGQFLQTLPPEEQDAFVEEFMSLQPQEQQMVVQRIMEMLTQSQQAQVAPGMQEQMPQEMMQEGGDIPTYLEFDRDMANVEVEGGETAMLPDGGLYRFQGAKHAQGGIPTVLPGGSKVFSEYLKVPKYITEGLLNKKTKKRYSYADLSKKFPTSKYEKILMDPNADGYAKRTAEIQLQRNQSMLDTIFNAQEMAKGEAPQEDMSMIDTEQLAMARQGMMMSNGYQYPFNVNFNIAGYGPRQSSVNSMGNYRVLPKAQTGTYTPEDDKFFTRMLQFENTQGLGSNGGMQNYGFNIYGDKAPTNYADALTTLKTTYIPENFPEYSNYPQELRTRLLDYKFNTGRDVNDLLLYGAGKLNLNQINQEPAHNDLWNQSKAEVEKLYTDPAFLRTLDDRRAELYKTTGQHTLENPNPNWESNWSNRMRTLFGYGSPNNQSAESSPVKTIIERVPGSDMEMRSRVINTETGQELQPSMGSSRGLVSEEMAENARRTSERGNERWANRGSQTGSTPQPQPSPSISKPLLKPGEAQMWTQDFITTADGRRYRYEYPNPDLVDAQDSWEGPSKVGTQRFDNTIPTRQRSRTSGGYGDYDVTTEPYVNDFKGRHSSFFDANPNFNPRNKQDVLKFQNWYNAERRKYGLKDYFTGNRGFSALDGLFGQYTWSAPKIVPVSDKVEPLPGPAIPTEVRSQNAGVPAITPAVSQDKPRPNYMEFTSSDDTDESRRNKFGISPKLAGTVLDIGLALNDRLRVDEPDYRDLRKYPIFDRFTDFDNQEISQQQALAIQNIQNSNMPEQVKQSMIANVTASAAQQQGRMDLANQGRYDQWRGAGLNKLQQYLDTNINQQAQDLDKYRREKAQVNYLRDQFNAQRKSRVVNSVRDYLNYLDQVNMANQLKSTEYRINPFTGRVNYTGYKGDPMKEQEAKMNEFRQAVIQGGVSLGPAGTLYKIPGGESFIITKDNEVKLLNK